MCPYDNIVANYTAECEISFGGNCDIDVDECASNPCQNGATCYQHVSNWTCDCTFVINNRTGIRRAYDGEMCESEIDVCSVNEDDCDPINAVCTHLGPGLHHCECNIGWEGDGSTCTDIDECQSSPCEHGATCLESFVLAQILVDAYRCVCSPGFSDGYCEYDFVSQYTTECSVVQSDTSPTGGNCGTDVDECVSVPCQNGAVCLESQLDGEVSLHAYRCVCTPGFANGLCDYGFISEYNAACSVHESTETTTFGGNCDVDVNECDSNPCANGAACSESTSDPTISAHAYRCTCVPGYANGWCEYSFISQYTDECTVSESEAVESLGGNCDVDVNECASSPCMNNATCSESTTRFTVAAHDYRCTCCK